MQGWEKAQMQGWGKAQMQGWAPMSEWRQCRAQIIR